VVISAFATSPATLKLVTSNRERQQIQAQSKADDDHVQIQDVEPVAACQQSLRHPARGHRHAEDGRTQGNGQPPADFVRNVASLPIL